MAEIPSKRQRENTQMEEGEDEDCKRYKSYNHILSILEEDDDEPNQDISSLITTLQHELSPDDPSYLSLPPFQRPTAEYNGETLPSESISGLEDYVLSLSSVSSPSYSMALKEKEDDDRGRVMKLLFEASDDELGIPNSEFGTEEDKASEFDNGGGEREGYFSLCDGLWELEDEAANYYTLLQSELFM